MITLHIVTRSGQNLTLEADTDQSLMEVLREQDLVDAICGGQAACATCHVHVEDPWMEILGEASGQELDILNSSLELKPNSRLSCQIALENTLNGLSVSIAQAE